MGNITLIGGTTLYFYSYDSPYYLVNTFPIELNFHKVKLLIPKPSSPIRIRVTDLNR